MRRIEKLLRMDGIRNYEIRKKKWVVRNNNRVGTKELKRYGYAMRVEEGRWPRRMYPVS
jgi:hypothetical protein